MIRFACAAVAGAVLFLRSRFGLAPVLVVAAACWFGDELGESFAGLTPADRLRGNLEWRLSVLEVAVGLLALSFVAFARGRDAGSGHLSLVLATPVARPAIVLGWVLGGLLFAVVLFALGCLTLTLVMALRPHEPSWREALPRSVIEAERSDLEGGRRYVLAPQGGVRASFPAPPSSKVALELRWRPLRDATGATFAHLHVRARSGDEQYEVEREFAATKRWLLALPAQLTAQAGPIDVEIAALPGSASFLIAHDGVVLRGDSDPPLEVLLKMSICFAGALMTPLTVAAVLGIFTRGAIAFILSSLVATAAACAPFFRDAARLANAAATVEPGAQSPALLARVSHTVVHLVPDLSPLRPSLLLQDLRASAAMSEIWPWLACAIAAAVLASFGLRHGPGE